MLTVICLLPAAVVILYILFILVKPQGESDLFFELHRKTTEESLIRRIEVLEKRNGTDYSDEKRKIRGYFRDERLSDEEVEFLENMMVRAYFNGFHRRWEVFRQADWFSRVVFLVLLLSGFMAVAVVSAFVGSKHPQMTDFMMGVAGSIILFPFSYAMVLIALGLLSLLLSIFRFVFPSRGSLARATVLSEEFVKALKPGGRSTKVVLPKSRFGPGGLWP